MAAESCRADFSPRKQVRKTDLFHSAEGRRAAPGVGAERLKEWEQTVRAIYEMVGCNQWERLEAVFSQDGSFLLSDQGKCGMLRVEL